MTKSELITRLSQKLPWGVRRGSDAELCVNLMLEALADTMVQGNRVEIRGFGTFFTSQRSGRVGRNPKLGARVDVPAKRVPRFRMSKQLVVELGDGKDIPPRRSIGYELPVDHVPSATELTLSRLHLPSL